MSAIAIFDEQPSSEPVTVQALITAYLRSLERRQKIGDVTREHLGNCARSLNNFADFVGDRLVQNCHQFDLTEWLRANPDWKSKHTKQRAISAVIGCFRWGADDEEGQLIDKCPYRFPKLLKGPMPEPRRPALHSEYIALMRAGSRPLRWALFFMWHTGCRTCEMREMLWTDIKWEIGCVRLEQHKTRKKTGKARLIPLSEVTVRFLRWLQKHNPSKHVFPNCDGGKWSRHVWCRHFSRTCDRIGLNADTTAKNLSAYCLRHSFACEAIENGDTFERVADRLGNSAEVVRKIYASHTRQHAGYLSRTAEEDAKRRRR